MPNEITYLSADTSSVPLKKVSRVLFRTSPQRAHCRPVALHNLITLLAVFVMCISHLHDNIILVAVFAMCISVLYFVASELHIGTDIDSAGCKWEYQFSVMNTPVE